MKSRGVDLNKWKDLPATFRETQEQTLETKSNKNLVLFNKRSDEDGILGFRDSI